eukprot:SAG22_NODE_1282_length_4892_cov_20.004173_2_plen_118_part_00
MSAATYYMYACGYELRFDHLRVSLERFSNTCMRVSFESRCAFKRLSIPTTDHHPIDTSLTSQNDSSQFQRFLHGMALFHSVAEVCPAIVILRIVCIEVGRIERCRRGRARRRVRRSS